LNTVESTILVVAIGWVYAATGTLNLADLPAALAALPDATRTILQLLLLVAFGMKAAVFPLFFWLPDSYPTAPSPVAALFAGLLTKVGVYTILRTQTLLFPGSLRTLLLIIAGLTMVVGVLGAIAQGEIKRILSFHIVSQIGYMILGIAIGGPVAIAATVFFLVHQIPVKTSLFLVEGLLERTMGSGSLERLSGVARHSALLAALFGLPALSLAGLPPFSGFVGKLGLLVAGVEADLLVMVAIALVGSLLTLVSMTKIWLGAFWGATRPATVAADAPLSPRQFPLMTAATVALVGVGLAIAAFSGPLYDYMDDLGIEVTTPGAYREAVMGE
ncbi:MAG: Na+/H+ antiporter subunit D, partial [Actinobacteria bacterium]|nr:Na+/H+ antiporter subunit D [Actinomycetota bacterium]